jgi:Iap family predicted aminopeptidase
MHTKKLTCLFCGLLLWSCSQAQQPEAISQPKVEQLMRTLASDQMKGRQVFTPGIEEASALIQEEFRKAGLKPLPGQTGFMQPFEVYELQRERTAATVNGQKLPAKDILVLTGQERIDWNQNSVIPVRTVGPDDNLREAVQAAQRENQDVLVLVHPKHQELFRRFQDYSARHGNLSLDPPAQKSVVLLLSGEAKVKTYEVQVRNKRQRRTLANVAGMIPGKSRPEEKVLFSAHYDHIGALAPVNGDSIANGADDDASGTAAVIALAHHFSRQPQPERTLIFAAFTAEEIGGFGSQYFSRQLNPDQIVAMFNIEMIGKPSLGPNTAFITGFERSDFGPLLQKALQGTPYQFHPDPYPEQNLFYRSDNATLARLGVPAHTISSAQIDQDPYYHTVDDELETLNLQHLTNMVQAIALSARDIVAGKATPTRIDKSRVD